MIALILGCLAMLLPCPARAGISVPLAWGPSSDPGVAGYKIYFGTASHRYTESVDVGNVTNTVIGVPVDNTTYYFAATTYDASGTESDFSNEATYVVPATVTNPPPATYQPPTISPLSNILINENAGAQTVDFSGVTPGSGPAVSVTASSSNPALIPNPTVSYTSPNAGGTLTFAPAPYQNGTATITVTVNNGQPANNLATQTFTVNVAPVNQAPTLNPLAALTLNYNSAAQTVSLAGITSGADNENQTLIVTAVSSNPQLVPNPVVNYSSPDTTGTLTLSAAANTNGTALITVTVNDGGAADNLITRTFVVNVLANYQPPTLSSLGGVSINENAGAQVVGFSGVTPGSGQAVSVTASSSNPALIPNPTVSYTSPNAGGTLTFAPAPYQNGTATITVTVNNGQPANNLATQTFTVNVAPVNQAPTLNPLASLTLNYNSAAQTVSLAGITSGADNEFQALTVKAVSSNTKLIPNPTVAYSSPLSTGTLTLKPAANSSGSATITVTVSDGGASNNAVTRTFTVTVKTQAASLAAPKLSSLPKSQVVLTGKTATFSVSATGSGTLKYQWKYNGTNVAGATGTSLTVKSCTPKQAGLYTVSVSNSGGSITSTPASLVVAATPAAVLVPGASRGGALTFDVAGVTGYKYAVQYTTNLARWIPVRTNTAPFTFSDTNSVPAERKFFRTVYIP